MALVLPSVQHLTDSLEFIQSLPSEVRGSFGILGIEQSLAFTLLLRSSAETLSDSVLTDPGDSSTPLNVDGFRLSTVQYTISNIGDSVTVRPEGSLDDDEGTARWFNLDPTGDTTHTSNGTYGMKVEAALKWIRLVFVSESGGTAVVRVRIKAI